jgi:hypothetical protein
LFTVALEYRAANEETPQHEGKKNEEETAMRNRANLVILAIAGAFWWPALAGAAPRPTEINPAAERTSALLAEIQEETRGLVSGAETLGTFARALNYDWTTHATHLNRVKQHINRVGEHLNEYAQMRHEVLPWQREAFDRVTSHAAQMAAST